MKSFLTSLSLLSILFLAGPINAQIVPTPFSKGVNLTNWFQAGSPQEIDFSKYSKEDFENIKSLGADVIRLPINLHSMTAGAPNYEIDSLFYFFLDQAVDWAEELEMYLILDNHTFDPLDATDPNIGDVLVPVWTQMATHYGDRSEYIMFEVLNEPHGIANSTWNDIQGDVIDAIRLVNTKHTIIVGPADYNSFRSLEFMPEYADTNLIYTFHFYDPFVLTHQGATWTDPSMGPLSGVPFPYDAASMPSLPASLAGTWIQGAFNNYANEGTPEDVRELLDIAIDFAETRGVPVFCGEFGVYIPNSDNESRVNWYGTVGPYLSENNIGWTIWDYQGGFGIFEAGTGELFDHDINVPLVDTLGFIVPEQTELVIRPDSVSFDIYRDFSAKGVSSSGSGGLVNLYDTENVYDGEFSISWTGATQYSAITFDFSPNKDLSRLQEEGYTLYLQMIGDTPGTDVDLRFIDTDTNTDGDRPWRANIRIDENRINFDGTWQEVIISLNEITEMGSWDDGAWHEPQGDFDWSAIDVFQIVAETGNHGAAKFWFDDIQINAALINSNEQPGDTPLEFALNQNYPNPFNPSTTISFTLAGTQHTSLKVYDLLGREVSVLVDEVRSIGNHEVRFDASALSSGVYLYELRAGDFVQTQKMLLVK
ncbi:MAG: T9SS C-terminal target domain-containing protein [Balneola sp.]|nr:MAG: T9SS C-terminal target domain-containing protein [Balneola sp.]